MTTLGVLVVLVVAMALLFDFVNGWNDSANAIATVVGTRVLSPYSAVTLAAALNLAGAMFGTEVANTMAKMIQVDPRTLGNQEAVMVIIIAGLLAAALWAGAMTVFGLPISGSHSLIGGVVGEAFLRGSHFHRHRGGWVEGDQDAGASAHEIGTPRRFRRRNQRLARPNSRRMVRRSNVYNTHDHGGNIGTRRHTGNVERPLGIGRKNRPRVDLHAAQHGGTRRRLVLASGRPDGTATCALTRRASSGRRGNRQDSRSGPA